MLDQSSGNAGLFESVFRTRLDLQKVWDRRVADILYDLQSR